MGERWSPTIGDPTAVGWITVVAYLVAALACYDVARRSRGTVRIAHDRAYLFWMGLALMLLALGINKQLDLQSLLTQVMRDAAKSEGWYAQRRHVQLAFILAIMALGAAALAMVPLALRTTDGAQKVAMSGMIFLYAFIVIRASSFHHVDVALTRSFIMLRLNWILELGGISIVLAGTRLKRRTLR